MTYILTKKDIAALRKADGLSVSLREGTSTVRATKKNAPTDADPYATDVDHIIPAPVFLRNFKYNADDKSARCFSHMNFWRGQDAHIEAVTALLRVGDDIGFEFYPDCHTNQYMEAAGLHGDVLRLIVTRGKRRLCIEIDHCHCPDNTARMCR